MFASVRTPVRCRTTLATSVPPFLAACLSAEGRGHSQANTRQRLEHHHDHSHHPHRSPCCRHPAHRHRLRRQPPPGNRRCLHRRRRHHHGREIAPVRRQAGCRFIDQRR